MKILKKHNTLLRYTFDPLYLEKYAEIVTSQHTSSYWQTGTENSYILRYEIFFQVKSPSSSAYFVNYQSNFELQCIIENVEMDAREVLHFKEMVNLSTQLFLMQNTQDCYSLLDFKPMIFSKEELKDQQYIARELNREVNNIKRIMGTLTLEEMSEEERTFVVRKNNQS